MPRLAATELARESKLNWARPEGYHVTMAFLGEIGGREIEVAASSLDALANFGDVPFSFSGLGGFPSKARWRVLIAGIDDGGRLRELHRRLGEALAIGATRAGIPPLVAGPRRGQVFSAHATIARLVSGVGKLPAPPLEEVRIEGTWTFKRCVLYGSELRSSGAVYTELREVGL
jgi:2'-5' RNA ligase